MRRALTALWIAASCIPSPSIAAIAAQQPAAIPDSAIVARIDAAVRNRFEAVLGFTDIEHYTVYRGTDQTHPAAEMTVKVTYRKGVGKTYTILSQSGSELVVKFGLKPLLDNEKAINDPNKVEESWFTSANYEMRVLPGPPEQLDGRACLRVSMQPRRKAPNMIDGTIWVDAGDDSILKVEGVASKSPSVWSGPARLMRRYAIIGGFAQATQARAESDSFLFGHTVVVIDYSDYQIELRP